MWRRKEKWPPLLCTMNACALIMAMSYCNSRNNVRPTTTQYISRSPLDRFFCSPASQSTARVAQNATSAARTFLPGLSIARDIFAWNLRMDIAAFLRPYHTFVSPGTVSNASSTVSTQCACTDATMTYLIYSVLLKTNTVQVSF